MKPNPKAQQELVDEWNSKPTMPDCEKARAIRAQFFRALEGAAPAYELRELHLFSSEEEKFIAKEVERKLYEPELPNGGSRERPS